MDKEALEHDLARGLSLAEIGRRVGLHEATVGYWVKKHGLEAANHAKYAAKGGLAEDELAPLVAAAQALVSGPIAAPAPPAVPVMAVGAAS